MQSQRSQDEATPSPILALASSPLAWPLGSSVDKALWFQGCHTSLTHQGNPHLSAHNRSKPLPPYLPLTFLA